MAFYFSIEGQKRSEFDSNLGTLGSEKIFLNKRSVIVKYKIRKVKRYSYEQQFWI